MALSPEELAAQLPELNRNLAALNENLRRLLAVNAEITKHLPAAQQVARQLGLMNQIMLQTSRAQGGAALITKVLEGLAGLARKAR